MTDYDRSGDVQHTGCPQGWPRIVTATRCWIDAVVVGLGFCPWASAVLDQPDGLSVQLCAGDAEARLDTVGQWLTHMTHQETPETVLLVVPDGLESFESYLDFVQASEELLEQMEFVGILQLASFHPDYCFAGEAPDDAANYTNRSPYPMLHILREESITRRTGDGVVARGVPERNVKRARSLGNRRLSAILEQCVIDAGRADV